MISSIKNKLKKMIKNQYRNSAELISPDAIKETIRCFAPIKSGHDLIRIGGDSDGGYLLPNDLAGVEACLSPGVAATAKFEAELYEKFGIKSFLADFSVEAAPDEAKKFDFLKKFLSTRSGDKYISMDNWISYIGLKDSNKDLILQMDIEGGEYNTIISMDHALIDRFRVMVIEFHFIEDIIYDRQDFFFSVFNKITKNHVVVHLHPNNCCGTYRYAGLEMPRVFEATFLRKDRIKSDFVEFRSDFPHPLDRGNVPDRPDLVLPAAWYG